MSNQHSEWLNLVPHSGPFLAEPVLDHAFPQGLEGLDPIKKKILRQAYDEWRDALDTKDSELFDLHRAWVELVLRKALDLDDDVLRYGDKLSDALSHDLPEHGLTLKPDYAVVDDQNDDTPLLLLQIYDPHIELEEAIQGNGWATSPAERMAYLCKATKTRLGLLTNGEQWLLVDAPEGGVTTYASWYSRLWGQEPITLQAFVGLLGVNRYFCEEERKLPHLIDESVKHQDEVTESLGEQVRRAVEVLIQALDKADLDRNRELLKDVEPRELYEAALTVMMRLVFLLCAEERDLLLLGDERYEASYAVSTLRNRLVDEADKNAAQVLEHRFDAWSRLLSTFRAVYGGIEHETLRLPALGGSLFDPDRFPFLEGRQKASNWDRDSATPLPIDNRTVLFLLEAIQLYRGRSLSFRALDVEQIGYVYEGLLERTAVRAKEVTLELDATRNAKEPWVTLAKLESAKLESEGALHELLKERKGSSISSIRNVLDKNVDDNDADKLLSVCRSDQELRDRIKPFFHLLRFDRWGYPLVYPKGAFIVMTATGRRETGTHYTPKSLTEAIVKETLEPIVFIGPAEGKERSYWQLKTPSQLLDLKICDPAMGSGAFLVQVCRYLSDRLVESWSTEEQNGKFIDSEGMVHEDSENREPLRPDIEERLITARRLIAERCLYGVDINPLAVELAKLSIWLVTLARGRPFGFLDHNLRSGDSLLGVTDLKQIMHLHIDPERGKKIHRGLFDKYKEIEEVLNEALEKRRALRQIPILDIEDVKRMRELDSAANKLLKAPELVADIVAGEALAAQSEQQLDERMKVRAMEAARHIEGDLTARQMLESEAYSCLNIDRTSQLYDRSPFHWPMEFPEVFIRDREGFDAIVGNPPFLGGQRITGTMGTSYRNYLVHYIAQRARGSVDLVAYFFLQAYKLIRVEGNFGLLAVNTIAEGATRKVGLEQLIKKQGAAIYAAYPNEAWPGKAAVVTSRVHIRKGDWSGNVSLNRRRISYISSYLSDQDEWAPAKLATNANRAFQGVIILGLGFTLSEDEALAMIEENPKNREVLFPYLNGQDLNTHPEQKPSRWVINFWDWPEERAKKYSEPYKIVLEKVKPERQMRKANGEYKQRNPLPQRWWQFAEKRPALYHAIGRGSSFESHPTDWDQNIKPLERVIVRALNSKHNTFAFVEPDQVIDQTLNVFAINNYYEFSILDSSIHEAWFYRYASTLGSSAYPRYIQSNIFLTFPFPELDESQQEQLEKSGRKLDQLRRQSMLHFQIGLTGLFNKLCDPNQTHENIKELRELKILIDNAILTAYGWDDIVLSHDFYEVDSLPENDRIRYTISEEARLEVMCRIKQLNKQRYDEEMKLGLHEKKKTKKKISKKNTRNKKNRKKTILNNQRSLFRESES